MFFRFAFLPSIPDLPPSPTPFARPQRQLLMCPEASPPKISEDPELLKKVLHDRRHVELGQTHGHFRRGRFHEFQDQQQFPSAQYVDISVYFQNRVNLVEGKTWCRTSSAARKNIYALALGESRRSLVQ